MSTPILDRSVFRESTKSPKIHPGLRISVSAPGKIILHGEHSVVYGKLALATSLGLRTKLSLVESENVGADTSVITVELQDLNLLRSFSIQDIQSNLLDKPLPISKNTSHFNYERPELINHSEFLLQIEAYVKKHSGSSHLSLIQKLALESFFYLLAGMLASVNVPLQPFHLSIKSDLTIGAGTGSSASYLVSLAATFLRYIQRKSVVSDLKDISKNGYKSLKPLSGVGNSFNKREQELISLWAFSAERIIHGSASGVDNTICTFGSMVEFRKGSAPRVSQLLCNFKILLVNTNVSRNTKNLVDRVAALRDRHPSVVNVLLDAMDKVAQSALEHYGIMSSLATVDKCEDPRSAIAIEECFSKLGELFDVNQGLLQALGVSHSSLDNICSVLAHAGLHGKLTGAGGGGYAIALLPPKFSPDVLQQVIKKLNSFGYEAAVTGIGGSGVTLDL